jgi:rhodanese-related sulfurtransferase
MNLINRLFGTPAPAVGATELREKLAGTDAPFLLDVRQPEEYRGGHIAGARLIPLGRAPVDGRRVHGHQPDGRHDGLAAHQPAGQDGLRAVRPDPQKAG